MCSRCCGSHSEGKAVSDLAVCFSTPLQKSPSAPSTRGVADRPQQQQAWLGTAWTTPSSRLLAFPVRPPRFPPNYTVLVLRPFYLVLFPSNLFPPNYIVLFPSRGGPSTTSFETNTLKGGPNVCCGGRCTACDCDLPIGGLLLLLLLSWRCLESRRRSNYQGPTSPA